MLLKSCDVFVESALQWVVSLPLCTIEEILIWVDRRVRYISCSATIAQPLKHMRAIFGIEVRPNYCYIPRY